MEYELAYNDFAVHCFNHFTTRTPSSYISSTETDISIHIGIDKSTNPEKSDLAGVIKREFFLL